MTEIAKREDSLALKMDYAKALAPSDLLPRQYRDKPANVLIAVEYGEALGLSPMAAIQGVHIIEGRPSASADMIAALIRKAGHTVRVTGDAKSATCQIIRKDDPDFVYETTWTIQDAQAAGLLGKDNWKKHPRQMLKRRAVSECGHDACSDVLAGLVDTDEAEESVKVVSATRLIPAAAQPIPEGVDAETGEIIEDAELVEDEPTITGPQRKALFAELKRVGMATKDDGLGLLTELLGRPVDSTEHLTQDEAAQLLAALGELPDAEDAA